MTRQFSSSLRWLACALFALNAGAAAAAAPKTSKAKRVLLFTRSAEYEHSTIKVGKDEQPLALGVLSALGLPHNWEFVHTKDGSFITAENLAAFDAFIFITTGDLTALRKDKDGKPLPADDINQKPMSPEGKAALLAAVEQGKGFVGLHNGSDTFHSPGSRWLDQKPEEVDPYIAMLGGEFISHGEQQVARVRVVDPKFPGFADLGATLGMKEEWYSLKNQASDLHALLVLESEAMTGPMYARPAYPVAWIRKHGKGRVFYSALGHREDVWTLPAFQKMLIGGLSYVLRQANASDAPNVSKAAPGYKTLPVKP
ncbi:MAG: ThuA domain-containing protein [Deltaproteobacteria bacterium]|nr:ThuA domain-containing protein [Deltaproteobacteria bacterium]